MRSLFCTSPGHNKDYNFDGVLEQNRGFQQSVTGRTGKFVNSYFAQQIDDICGAVLIFIC